MLLNVSHVSKSYPGLPVLQDVSFAVGKGEIGCFLGPSGCGKTTLLRMVAGLETPDTGSITFAGQDLSGVPVHRRNFGLMFQDYVLFPHKNAEDNVAFGLRMQQWPPTQIAKRVSEMLRLVELDGYEHRRVSELSGGEQQRVALARSLAPGPRLLMLDEPLGSLDRALREQLMNDLRAILKQVGVTTLYVTHDQEEAFAIADRVFIMRARLEQGEGGRIVQEGTPQEVYCQPASMYVARFLGFRNLLEGTVIGISKTADMADYYISSTGIAPSAGQPCSSAPTPILVETDIGILAVGNTAKTFAYKSRVTLLIRPEAASILTTEAANPTRNVISGHLVSSSFRGSSYLIHTVHAGGVVLTSVVSATDTVIPPVGSPLLLRLDPAAISLL
jgi:ABC-type Fe3+/spermidine/putrescine transport system ATPase subunit